MNKAMLLILLPAALGAQDITVDEDVLFADTTTVVDSASLVGPAWTQDKKTVGFSGNILAVGQGGLTRDYFGGPDVEESNLSNAVVGNLALDARLLRNYKAFAELELSYAPVPSGLAGAGGGGTEDGAAWRLPEMFLDANIAHRVYFRAGKQVLQWGRAYFFNPTDLINVERKTFFRRIGSREGVYGLKAHVPFGTAWNIYGFVDAQGVGRPDSLAGAFRLERLWGRTEMSAMVWGKGSEEPVYGADLSTRLLGLDVKGELALYQEFETRTFTAAGGAPVLGQKRDDWAPRAVISLGRSFRVSGIQDRLTTIGEYYFNGPGNTDRRLGLAQFLQSPIGSGLTGAGAVSMLEVSGFYEPNSYSRHYAAFFATFNRFLRRDITLTFNALGNLNQRAALLSGGIAYRDINDFGLSLLVNGFAGPEDTEYTLAGQALQVQLIAEAAF